MGTLLQEFEKLSKDYFHGGKADNQPDEKYDSKQLRMGMNVEMEHTNNREKAKEITKDHLEEFDNYYTGLKKMEKGLEKEKKASLNLPYYRAQFVKVASREKEGP